MINIKKLLLLKEDRNQANEYGCLMALFPKEISAKLVEFGKKLIKEEDLYKEGSEFGREHEGHVTIRYGFTKDLNELEIRQLLKGQKQFIVELYGLDTFGGQPNKITGEKQPYDVVFLKARSPVLSKLNEATKEFPHVDTFSKEYHPHATLFYSKPGVFSLRVLDGKINLSILVNTIYYSPISGEKSYFELEK
jgi:2'-5' RNA ligase